jgi:glycosyltransferase involved in cell wall biosynthesis
VISAVEQGQTATEQDRRVAQTGPQPTGNDRPKGPINVLWVIDHVCYDGSLHGGGRLYWNVVPRFDPRRVRIVPCFLRSSEVLRRVFADAPAPVRILEKSKFDITTVWTLLRLIRSEHIDVMHLHCYGASSFGRIAGWIAGVPTIVHDYDTEVYFPYPWYLWLFDRVLSGMTRGAVAASPMVREFAIRSRKIAPGKIRLMFHAVPEEKFKLQPGGRIAAVRKELGAGPETEIVGTVTKLGPQRGNADLVRAAHKVLQRRPETIFLLVYKETIYHRDPQKKYVSDPRLDRSEEGRQGLLDFIRRLGIEDRVRLMDSLDRSDELIAAMDLVVAPFRSRRFSSVKLLEAMAQAKPVVASELGEQRELIRNGQEGYLVPPGDVDRLAERILHCLAHPEERRRLGRQARETARRHSVDSVVADLENWYYQMAAENRRRRGR